MSNVASLELCRELYELSGWGDTEHHWWPDWWTSGGKATANIKPIDLDPKIEADLIPAYDLGYLVRKLPEQTSVYRYENVWVANRENERRTGYPAIIEADTPENAVASLAILLFQQGILTQPEPEQQG